MFNVDPSTPPKPPLTIGGVIMVLVGGTLLLFPGGCSLIAILLSLVDAMSARPNLVGVLGIYLTVSAIGFLVAGIGYWLMRAGLRRRKPAPPESP